MRFYLTFIFIGLFAYSCVITSENFTQPRSQVLPPTEIGPYSFKANWTRIVTAKAYQLEVIAQKDGKPVPLDTARLTSTSFRVTNLEVNQRYSYRVRVNLGNGRFSEPSEWMDALTRVSNLESPQALAAVDRTALEFTARWTSVQGIRSYLLQVASDPGMNNIVLDTILTDTAYRVYSSNFDIPYYYHVAALNEQNNEISLYSDVITVPRGVSATCKLTYLSLINTGLSPTTQEFKYDNLGRLVRVDNKGENFFGIIFPWLDGQPGSRFFTHGSWYPDFSTAFYETPFPFAHTSFQYTNTLPLKVGNDYYNGQNIDDFSWHISYVGNTDLIKEAYVYDNTNNRVMQRRRFNYFLDASTQQLDSVIVELLNANYSNRINEYWDRHLPKWTFHMDQKGRVTRWKESRLVNDTIPLHPIYNLYNIQYIYDEYDRIIETRGKDDKNTVLYEYDFQFNPIALLRNPLLTMFVYSPRATILASGFSTVAGVGFNIHYSINNLQRIESKSTLDTRAGSDINAPLVPVLGRILRFGAITDNVESSKTKTFATELEGTIGYNEIRFEGCQ